MWVPHESFRVTSGRPLLCSHVKGCLGSFAQGLKSDPLTLKQLSMRDKLFLLCSQDNSCDFACGRFL